MKSFLVLFLFFPLLSFSAYAQIQFCGETLPTDQPDIQQRVRSQQIALSQSVSRLKQRVSSISPTVDPVLDRNNIPREFKYVLLAEGLRHSYSRSYNDRAGFWQLTPQNARRFGLMVAGRHRDQRYDLHRSTLAACQYITQLYREFGSWALVAAAYTDGAMSVRRIREQFPQASVFGAAYHPDNSSRLYQAIALKELVAGSVVYADRVDPYNRTAPPIRSLYPEPSRRKRTTSVTESLTASADGSAFKRVRAVTGDAQTETPTPTSPTPATVAAPPIKVAVVITPTKSTAVAAPAPVPGPGPGPTETSALIDSRSIGNDLLAEGQAILFEVIQPQTFNGFRVAVGDVIYAHIEAVNSSTGRVFLRADRVMSGRTQESIRLNLVAVEKPKEPGVQMPTRAGATVVSGWRLAWEAQ